MELFYSINYCESSSAGRAPRCQRGCREFESRLSLSLKPSIFVADNQDQLNISHFYIGKQMETLMHHNDEISDTIFFNERDNK